MTGPAVARRAGGALLSLLAALGPAGCGPRGGEGAPAASGPREGAIEVRLPDGAPFRLAARPARIVCANTAAAEFVCPLVDAGRLAALPEQVDRYSDVARAPAFARVPRFDRYHAEAMIALRPDLVVTHVWQSAETSAVLRGHGVPVLVLSSASGWEEVRATVELFGALLEARPQAERWVAELDARVERLRAGAAAREGVRAVVYSNDGTGGWAAGAETTADALLAMCGMRNAAAAAGVVGHQAFGFERLIGLDPDLVVVGAPAVGEGGSATRAVLVSTKELAHLRAVRERRIAVIPSALLSADSPRIVEAAEALAAEADRALAAVPR